MRCICGREFPYTKPGLSPNESPSFLSLKFQKGLRRLKVHKYSDLLYLILLDHPQCYKARQYIGDEGGGYEQQCDEQSFKGRDTFF